jgi:hypothetical protein
MAPAMLKLALSATGAVAIGLTMTAFSSAAGAQTNSRAEIIVFGNDPCPRDTNDNIVVCVHRPEEERYRIPKAYRETGTRQQSQSWSAQSQAMRTIGATGAQSCSAVGPGGHTGCLAQAIDQAKKEYEEEQQSQTAPVR